MRSQLSEVGIPALATGDGNCLFNSMSIALTADEVLAPELRLRTAIEMSLNQDQYKNRRFQQLNELLTIVRGIINGCLYRPTYMSIWNVIALSTVVGNPVHSVYPPMNGEKDKTPPILNKVFSTDENKHRNSICIMWSRLGPCRGTTWTPNHFVPVMQQTKQECTPQPKTYTSTPRHSVTKGQTITLNDECGKPVRITKVTINMPPIDIRMYVDPDETIVYGRNDHGSSSIGNLHSDAVNENTILPSVSTGNLHDESTSDAVNKNPSLPSDVNVSRHRESEQHNRNVSDNNIPFIESTPDISKENSTFNMKIHHLTLKHIITAILKPRLEKYVFEPTRKVDANKNWTNNNAESINNILKISIDWKPKHTEELIMKLYSVTELHFMDYRSAIHDSGNYELVPAES